MTRRQLLSLLVLVMLGVGTSYLLRTNHPLGLAVGDSPAAIAVLQDRTAPQVAQGAANLTVVTFTDYQCPACRAADSALRAALARDGNVRIVYKDWPIFGERSERAAQVALAAHRQGIYRPVHHALMRSPGLDDAALQRAVETSGGSWKKLESDLLNYKIWIEEQILNNRREAFSLGLRGTPAYLIGPLLVQGALSEREFRRAFGQARSERGGR